MHGIRHRRGLAIIGYVKTHHPRMLAREHWVRVPELTAGERSGLFAMENTLYGCYLRVGDPGGRGRAPGRASRASRCAWCARRFARTQPRTTVSMISTTRRGNLDFRPPPSAHRPVATFNAACDATVPELGRRTAGHRRLRSRLLRPRPRVAGSLAVWWRGGRGRRGPRRWADGEDIGRAAAATPGIAATGRRHALPKLTEAPFSDPPPHRGAVVPPSQRAPAGFGLHRRPTDGRRPPPATPYASASAERSSSRCTSQAGSQASSGRTMR